MSIASLNSISWTESFWNLSADNWPLVHSSRVALHISSHCCRLVTHPSVLLADMVNLPCSLSWHEDYISLLKFRPKTYLVRIRKWLVALGFRTWTSDPPPLVQLSLFGQYASSVHIVRNWCRALYIAGAPLPDAKGYTFFIRMSHEGLWQNIWWAQDETESKSKNCTLNENKSEEL